MQLNNSFDQPSFTKTKWTNGSKLGSFAIFAMLCVVFLCISQHDQFESATETGRTRVTLSEAEKISRQLCSRIAGSQPTLISSSENYHPASKKDRSSQVWEITHHADNGFYTIELNADSAEILLFRHEKEHGDIPSPLKSQHDMVSHKEALYYARSYLKLLGLPLPGNAKLIEDRPGYAFVFEFPISSGRTRLLLVRINPFDGTLESVRNLVYYATPPKDISSY